MKKVLITGATGFIGGALTQKLIKENIEVHVLIRENSDMWRLQNIQKYIFIHRVDLRNLFLLKRIVKEINPDIIYHCATHGGYHFQNNAADIIETNFIGTVNLLTACLEIDFDYFVNTGSSSEYGIKNHMHKENDVLLPLGDYAVSKAAATLHCQSIRIQRSLPITTLRLFSPYGPWDAPSRFIPYVVKSFITNESPKISTPTSVRDYVYIDDVIDAYLSFLNLSYIDCDIVNIGSGNQTELSTIVELVQNKTNKTILPMWGEIQVRKEPEMWQADIGLANKMLHWSPKVNIADGLQKTIDWMGDNSTYY